MRRAVWLMAGALACGGRPDLTIETIATGGVAAPTLARAADGTVYVAWVATDSVGSNVWLARRDPGGIIHAPVRVNDRAGDAQPHTQAPPQVVAGPGVAAVSVLWSNATAVPGRRFPASDLRFARSDDRGRTFAPAVYVNDDAGGPPAGHTFHDLAVSDDGTIYAAWLDSRRRGPPSDAGHATHTADGDAVGAPPAGGDGSDIRVARSTDGGRTFSAGVVVDSAVCPCCRTALVAAGSDVWVAWRKVFAGNVRDVVVARSTDAGRTFNPPVRVHADGWVYPGCPHAGPALARTADGILHITWFTGAAGRQGLHHAVSRDQGRSFDAPVPLQPDGPVPASLAALGSAGDRVWRVWEDRTGRGPVLRVAAVPGRAVTLGTGTAPDIVAGPLGPLVAWVDQGAVRLASVR